MTMKTARHGLPLLAPGQAQKELFHNEALSAVDTLLHVAVESVGATEPTADPAPGQSWIIGTAPTGAWTGHAQALACWTEGGWRFHQPTAGMRAVIRETRVPVEWDGAGWRKGEVNCLRVMVDGQAVVGARGAAIADPAGGGVIDTEARGAIGAILTALRKHGLVA